MKPKKIYLIIFILILLLSGCLDKATYQNTYIPEAKEDNNTTDNNNGYSLSFSLGQPLSIDKVIEKSYFILKCKLLTIDSANEQLGSRVYVFEYLEAIKGQYDDKNITVTIYDFDAISQSKENIFLEGEEYVLCLEKADSIFHGVSYTLCSGLCMKVDGDQILQVYQRAKSIDTTFETINLFTNKISDIVKNIELNNEDSVSRVNYIFSSDPAEIVDFSSYIVKVKVVENTTPSHASKKIEEYRCETIEAYKGSTQDILHVIVYAGSVNIGDEYLMLLECAGGNSYVISSDNSCISVDNKSIYNEYISYLD